jgi:hypothetical protein
LKKAFPGIWGDNALRSSRTPGFNLNLTLRAKAPRMEGHPTIHFDLSRVPDPLVLDFPDIDESVRNLRGNQTQDGNEYLHTLFVPGCRADVANARQSRYSDST